MKIEQGKYEIELLKCTTKSGKAIYKPFVILKKELILFGKVIFSYSVSCRVVRDDYYNIILIPFWLAWVYSPVVYTLFGPKESFEHTLYHIETIIKRQENKRLIKEEEAMEKRKKKEAKRLEKLSEQILSTEVLKYEPS